MKYIVFLGDGMADEPIEQLSGKTPLMAANTPNMDWIAKNGVSGTVRTLFKGYPTSSDVANMGVLGYDVKKYNFGRGPIEAASRGITLAQDEIAFRCNLITQENGVLKDYSGGHITQEDSQTLIKALDKEFGNGKIRFIPGVSYRNLLVLKGEEFSAEVEYSKPDDKQDSKIDENILLKPKDPNNNKQKATCELLNHLTLKSKDFLATHPINVKKTEQGKAPANMIWTWSPGGKPKLPLFFEKYGKTGAIISAVDVIFGLAVLMGLTPIRVKGATGWIDTNYEGKADACIEALEKYDFVFVHVEAADECGHLGDLDNKIKAIEDFDRRLMGRVIKKLGSFVSYAIIPDHPVPLSLRKHTLTPVPASIFVPGIQPDSVSEYNEESVKSGKLGELHCLDFLKTFFSY